MPVAEQSAEAAISADFIVGGVGHQTGRAVFEAVSVVIEGVGGLADETLVSGSIECTLGDDYLAHAGARDTEFEADSA